MARKKKEQIEETPVEKTQVTLDERTIAKMRRDKQYGATYQFLAEKYNIPMSKVAYYCTFTAKKSQGVA